MRLNTIFKGVVGVVAVIALIVWGLVSCVNHEEAHSRYRVTTESGEYIAWRVTIYTTGGCAGIQIVGGGSRTICGTFEVVRLPNV